MEKIICFNFFFFLLQHDLRVITPMDSSKLNLREVTTNFKKILSEVFLSLNGFQFAKGTNQNFSNYTNLFIFAIR